VRVTAAFSRLLALPGVWVRGVDFQDDRVVVDVVLRRRRLICPQCGYSTPSRRDTRPDASTWRHLDLGTWRLEVRAPLARLTCPTHGVITEAVPFARHRSDFIRDFEDLVGYLATTADKTTITRLVRIDWDTVGRIISRVLPATLFGDEPAVLCGDGTATLAEHGLSAVDPQRSELAPLGPLPSPPRVRWPGTDSGLLTHVAHATVHSLLRRVDRVLEEVPAAWRS